MPAFVLTLLKFALLAVLYLFIYRAVRTIVRDLYGGERRRRRQAAKPARAPAATGTSPRRVVAFDETGKRLASRRLDGTLQIGRGAACEMRLDDRYLSQVHARISQRGDGWVVEDMGSTNGTYLNNRKLTVPSQISVGDRIRLGKTVLEVQG